MVLDLKIRYYTFYRKNSLSLQNGKLAEYIGNREFEVCFKVNNYKTQNWVNYRKLQSLKLFPLRAASDRPLQATWAKTAAPTWLAGLLRSGSCSSLNEASLFVNLKRE